SCASATSVRRRERITMTSSSRSTCDVTTAHQQAQALTNTTRDDAPGVIAIDHVSMTFPGRDASQSVHALDDVSLDIRKGEFVCLLGPSGCGKSTLLSIIGGLTQPTAGSVTISGV